MGTPTLKGEGQALPEPGVPRHGPWQRRHSVVRRRPGGLGLAPPRAAKKGQGGA